MIVGVGWLTVLGFWLADAGPMGASLAFVIGMLFFIPVGLCYAEMAGMYPHTGGPIIYALHQFGVVASFIAGWMLCLTFFFVIIFEALSVGWLMEVLWPSSMGPKIYSFMGSDIHVGHLVFGIGGNILLAIANWRGGSTSGKAQSIMTFSLIITILILIVAALFNGQASNLEPLFIASETGSIWPGVVTVLLTVPFYLTGFEAIAQGMGERDKNISFKTIARIIVISIIGAALFYVAIIISASSVAPRDLLVGAELPAAKAFEIGLGSAVLMKLALIGGLLGLLSTWNGCIFVFVRAIWALGKNRMIWPGFAKTNKAGISILAIWFVIIVVAFGVGMGKNAILPLVNSSSTAVGLLFFIVCLAVIKSRFKTPDSKRPFKAPGGLVLPIIGCLASLWVVVLTLQDPYTAGEGIPLEWWLFGGWVLFGAVLWFIGAYNRKKEGYTLERMIKDTSEEIDS